MNDARREDAVTGKGSIRSMQEFRDRLWVDDGFRKRNEAARQQIERGETLTLEEILGSLSQDS